MNSMKLSFLVALIVLTVSGFAQKTKTDSLLTRLEAAEDAEKVEIFNTLSFEFSYIDPAKAYEYASGALTLAQKLNDRKGEAKSLLNFGHLSFDKANYQDALKYYIKALKISESANDEKGITNALVNVGNVYFFLEDFDKCLEYYKKTLSYYEKAGDRNNMSVVLTNIGGVYMQIQQYEKALEYLFLTLEIDTKLNNKRALSTTLLNIGTSYRELAQYQDALKYMFESLKLKEELKENQEGLALLNIAGVYTKLNDKQKAEDYYSRALKFAQQNGDKNLMKLAYQEMSDMYKANGDLTQALKYKDLFIEVKDSIFNSENSRLIAEMESKYQSEKKQKEIELLTKDKQQEKMMKNFLGGGVVMVLLLAGVIYNRYRVKHRANQQLSQAYMVIEEKSKIVEEKNKDITASIKYANRIQQAILPTSLFASEFGEKGFILYKPKDIVSGDFYWMEKRDGKVLVAAVDCTGHGVPGAFMSIVGYNLLNQIVNEEGVTVPAEILNRLTRGVTETLRQKVEESTVKDGMDLALCAIDYNNMMLEFSGAYNPLWLLRDGHMIEVKADKCPIGAFLDETIKTFTNHRIELQHGDIIYLFSDGYADQFGGPSGKKFKYKKLKELLVSIEKNKMHEQRDILDSTIEAWKGNLEQVDDIMVIGIKI